MIIVTSLRSAGEQVTETKAERVISILSPDMAFPSFESVTGDAHLRLSFHDVGAASPRLSAPGAHDMMRLLTFIRAWERTSPLLIHCWAGISRSTASAYAALCMMRPDEDELVLAQELRDASPSATPNRLIISQVDLVLGREGRMEKAIAAIGRGADAYEGKPFVLKL